MRCRQGSRSTGVSASPSNLKGASPMLRNVILWFAGVPIFVIILLNVFGFLS
jgi:hypothetical protein